MAEDSVTLKLEIKNEKAREDLLKAVSTAGGYRLRPQDDPSSCDLLIVEITGQDIQKEFEHIYAVQNSGAAKGIFLTSSSTDSNVLIQALRAGVKEFLPMPLDTKEVAKALLKFKEELSRQRAAMDVQRSKEGRIINIFGGKGGVGTTTIAVNLASGLLEQAPNKSVALIDMNLLFGEVPLFLDLEPAFDWAEVSRNIDRLDAHYLMSILAKHPSGLWVLPSPTRFDGVVTTKPVVVERILALMRTVFDFIVIDSGSAIDQISMEVFKQSHETVLVAIQSLPCLVNIKRLMGTFLKLGYPPLSNIRVVVNRYHKKSQISIDDAEESLGTKVFWTVRNDYDITVSAINQGKPLSVVAGKSDVCKDIKELAGAFLRSDTVKNENLKGVFGVLKSG